MKNLKKIELELEKHPVFTCVELLKKSLKIIVGSLYFGMVLTGFLFLVIICVFGVMGGKPDGDFAVIYLIFFYCVGYFQVYCFSVEHLILK